MTLSLGWFSTGRGPGSRGLFQFIQSGINDGTIPANLEFVFSNREPGESEETDLFFELVHQYKIPLLTLSSRRFFTESRSTTEIRRREYDRKVSDLIQKYPSGIYFLSGYMLIIGPELCKSYTMLNLHPALPSGPTGKWQDVIWSIIDSNCRETGAMIHIAIEEVDRGPVVSYFTLPLTGKDFDHQWDQISKIPTDNLKREFGESLPLFQLIRQEEYKREPLLMAETIKALANRDIIIKSSTVFDHAQKPSSGLCLNNQIENLM